MGKYEEQLRQLIRDEMAGFMENHKFEVEMPQSTSEPQPKKCVGPNCNHTVSPKETYCKDCLTCPECGTVNKAEDRYCDECNEEFEPLK